MNEFDEFSGLPGVTDYRVYFLNARGHIVRAAELSCVSDAEAIEKAAALAKGQPAELWERARLVDRFAPAAANPG